MVSCLRGVGGGIGLNMKVIERRADVSHAESMTAAEAVASLQAPARTDVTDDSQLSAYQTFVVAFWGLFPARERPVFVLTRAGPPRTK